MSHPFATVLRALVLLLFVFICRLEAQHLPLTERERDLTQLIRVGVHTDAYPYSFRDANGQVVGFSVDLLNAVARVMELRIERIPLTNTSLAEALRSGQVDMLQSWSETPARRPYTSFSTPYLRCETVVVLNREIQDVNSLSDLKGRRVGVGQMGNVGDRVLAEKAPDAIRVYRESSTEFLRLVESGECDAAVLSRLTAASIMHRDRYRNVRILDLRLPGYDVRYCFATRRGDDLLVARLNEGLAILHRTGDFDEIYSRWFGQLEKPTISPLQLLSAVAALLALVAALASVGFLRQRRLSERIARQAAELSGQRALLAALHDNHPLATLVLDVPPPPGAPLIVSLNKQARTLFDLDPALAPTHTTAQLLIPADTQAFLDAVLERWRNASSSLHWELCLPDSRRWLEVFLVPLGPAPSPAPEQASRLCLLASDITARRNMDQEIALSRRQRALGELVGGVAHEFNNLLTPILATASQLHRERGNDSALLHELQTIEEAARRGSELTRRLLTFGRRGDEHATPVLLTEAVRSSIELLRHTIDRRIVLRCEPAPALAPLLFNRTDLHQIIFNLLINARDTLNEKLAQTGAADWQPAIVVSFEELSADALPLRIPARGRQLLSWQVLSVRDNGMGIPAEIMDRIYEPFFTTKEVGTGSGLGLATTWHLVNEAGGTIDIESRVGQHSCFRITFPRWALPASQQAQASAQPQSRAGAAPFGEQPAPPHPEPEPAASAPDGKGPATTPRPLSILLAEDEDAVARVVTRILERLGHRPRRFPDGLAAWEHLSAGDAPAYDVLILDMNMPRMNGMELATRIQNLTTHGRVLVMSGRVTEAEHAALERLGVHSIINKPVSVETLRNAVEGGRG